MALSFNGTTARVRVPDAPVLDLTTAVTVEAWPSRRRHSLGGGRSCRRKSIVPAARPDSGSLRPAAGMTVGSAVPNVLGPTALPVGVWSHLAVTYDGAQLRLYVNGVQVADRAQTGAIAPSGEPTVDRRQQPVRGVLQWADR